MALSLLEVKDCPPSSSSGSESLPPGERPNQGRSLDIKKQTNTEVCSSQLTLKPQLHVTDRTVSRPPGSVPKQSEVGEIYQKMDTGDLDPAEEHKQPKKRRQRRRGAQRQIVGLPPSPSAASPVLLWFRRDLRLCDNPALIGSLAADAPVVPVFIWSPDEEEGPGTTVAMGGACR